MHWSSVGDVREADAEIMAWARADGRLVFTQDNDFAATLAMTRATSPSVVQIRGRDVLPEDIGPGVRGALQSYAAELARGAVVIVEPARARRRVLPL